jgi:hypothetical protein
VIPAAADVTRWLTDPNGGVVFPRQRGALEKHNKDCPSHQHAWLPHRGGVSSPSDFEDCFDCGVVFFWEGLGEYEIAGEETALCFCCARRRRLL